jgi:hypothetical protein
MKSLLYDSLFSVSRWRVLVSFKIVITSCITLSSLKTSETIFSCQIDPAFKDLITFNLLLSSLGK